MFFVHALSLHVLSVNWDDLPVVFHNMCTSERANCSHQAASMDFCRLSCSRIDFSFAHCASNWKEIRSFIVLLKLLLQMNILIRDDPALGGDSSQQWRFWFCGGWEKIRDKGAFVLLVKMIPFYQQLYDGKKWCNWFSQQFFCLAHQTPISFPSYTDLLLLFLFLLFQQWVVFSWMLCYSEWTFKIYFFICCLRTKNQT